MMDSPMASREEAEGSSQQPLEPPPALSSPSSCSGERPGPTQVCSSLRAHRCLLGWGFGKGRGVVPCRG